MNENVCKECAGEVEVGEICHFCGASPEGFENCGASNLQVLFTWQRDTERDGFTTNPSTGLPMEEGDILDSGGYAVGQSPD
jgi:hypothetical protein